MLVIDNKSTNPYFNLAFEEYILKKVNTDAFMLWINEPAIIVGKNQNTLAQINLEYVKEHNIPVVRRLSGGGAVFHDLGNLNFTFISDNSKDSFVNFGKFTKPIIEVLKNLSIDTQLSGRNDLTIDGRKFSGNAQYIYKDKILHHGTLLFKTNVSKLSSALKVEPSKFKDKGVKSVSSRVTNISEHIKDPMDIQEFKDMILEHILANYDATPYNLSHEDISNIEGLVNEKYGTWEWNFGHSPKYNFRKHGRFKGGSIEIHLNVEKGIIQDIKIYGDFFGKKDIKELEAALAGVKHSFIDIKSVLVSFNIQDFFANITLDEILNLFF